MIEKQNKQLKQQKAIESMDEKIKEMSVDMAKLKAKTTEQGAAILLNKDEDKQVYSRLGKGKINKWMNMILIKCTEI